MSGSMVRTLNRKELRKRLEARRDELTARIRDAEADAAKAAKSHTRVWLRWLEEIESAMSRGIDKLEDDVVERLYEMLDRSPDEDKSAG